MRKRYFKHPTAEVSEEADIGDGTNIWHYCQIRENARIGEECNLGKSVYVDIDVIIGDRVKIQNRVNIYHGVVIEDDVFLGPSMTFTNDLRPRAFIDDFEVGRTLVKKGASIGANATILSDLTIGEYAMVGAGAVVTKDVPSHALVLGNPARIAGAVCKCGRKMELADDGGDGAVMRCAGCGFTEEIKGPLYSAVISEGDSG